VSAFRYQLSSRSRPITVEGYRRRARRVLPDMVWAYVDFGSETETTLRANCDAFARWSLRTKVLTGVAAVDLTTSVAGTSISLPILLAPTGLVGLTHWSGEAGVAQAAERAGTLSIVSTSSTYTFEEVATATSRNHHFQLYPCSDENGLENLTLGLMQRAQRSGYEAMFVTVDVPAVGNREAERRRGMGNPPVLTPRRVINGALHPRWSYNFMRHKRVSARNLIDRGGAKAAVASVATYMRMINPELNWDHLAWMRQQWKGPLFVKGILEADDAERAVALGADGVVVSNHGGRQLDYAMAALDALPAIAARVGGRAEVILDGGVRRGSDVVKALCLGADAVCIGRPYLYGLAAEGPAGVEGVIEILREEMLRTMTLMGVSELNSLDRSCVVPVGTDSPRPLP
jgi:isopentenyl diphosphate isomerase/L-lactate dehydrogenase-like FMN-dependent dehydrogenase